MRLRDVFGCCFRGAVPGKSGKKVRKEAKRLRHQLADQLREGEILQSGCASPSPSPPPTKRPKADTDSAGVSVSPGTVDGDCERGQQEKQLVIGEAGCASPPSPTPTKPSQVGSGSAAVSVSAEIRLVGVGDWERGQLEEHLVRDKQDDERRCGLHGWFERRQLADERKKALEVWRASGKLSKSLPSPRYPLAVC